MISSLVTLAFFACYYKIYLKMAVVYNYFEPIPIPDPENPKLDCRICKACSKPKKIEKGKTSIV